MEFFGLIFFFVAMGLVIRMINSVRSSSPEEKYFQTFGVVVGAGVEETEQAFWRVFINAKQPLAPVYRQLTAFGDRELTKEETKQRSKLKDEETKVLKSLKDLLETASLFKPTEAKGIAEELHIDQLIAPILTPKVVISSSNS